MAAANVHYVYKETRLNLEPQSASSIVEVQVNSANGLNPSRPSSQRTSGVSLSPDEKAYRSKHLATASSIYTRKNHDSPRSFLWRVLENDTILSIRVADVCKKQKEADSPLILHIRFSSPLRTQCISLSDCAEHDALTVFAIDYANNLHSITLRPDVFRKRSATDGGLGDAVKTYSPPGFGFKHPHRLVAVSPEQFIVTMHDGGILRFDKSSMQDAINGSPWKETIYNVTGWGQHLRGLIPYKSKKTIPYDRINMELTAATSAATTTMGHQDTAFLFTICLDHRLRVWDVRTGQILYTGDIVDTNRGPQDENDKWTIHPSQSNLIRIIETGPGQCLVVTYSPVGSGEFKFWKVKANNQGSILVVDSFPQSHLGPPPTPAQEQITWTMVDFGVAQQEEGPELWTLWKHNLNYRVRAIQVRNKSRDGPFNAPWTGVVLDKRVEDAEPASKSDPVDEAERWLELIFAPGRFAKSILETALAMYEKGSGTAKDSSTRGNKTLVESICTVIGSTISLPHNSTASPDYEQFRKDSRYQWQRFYRLLLELDKQRGEAISLVVDSEIGMPWVICADLAGAVRTCSNLDLVYHNMATPEKNSEHVARLINTGLDFVLNFKEDTKQRCRAALRSELFDDPDKTDEERLQYFYDKSAFYLAVADDVANEVQYNLGQDFRTVTPALYEDLLDLLKADSDENMREIESGFTPLGQHVIIRATQDASELQWQILFSQLILLVHMEFEIEVEEETLHARFDVGAVYRKILTSLRRLEHIKWMTKTEMAAPEPTSASSRQSLALPGTGSPTLPKRTRDEPQNVTALEGILGHLLGVSENNDQPLMASITSVVTNLCAQDSDIELVPYLHQCFLLKANRPDLALQLSPFADQDSFSTYIQGRVFLALQNYDTAAEHFKKAAVGLSISMRHIGKHSSGLLDDMEWKLLNSGLPKYYSHIVNLFDKQKAYSFVIEFARLALQFTDQNDRNSAVIDAEILSRLFTAATTISHFDMAHSALLSMRDEAMQKSYLRRLVEKMCETGQNRELVALPFAGLQDKVDEILLEKCKSVKDVLRSPVPYHQVLYAWRVSRNDYRGGAAVLHDRLQKLRQAGEGDKLGGSAGGDDVMDTAVTRQYLLLINALSCIEPKQAYILEELPEDERMGQMKLSDVVDMDSIKAVVGSRDDAMFDGLDRAMAKNARRPQDNVPRKAITLADLRKQYQEELDRIVAIQTDQFEFTGEEGDEMDMS